MKGRTPISQGMAGNLQGLTEENEMKELFSKMWAGKGSGGHQQGPVPGQCQGAGNPPAGGMEGNQRRTWHQIVQSLTLFKCFSAQT